MIAASPVGGYQPEADLVVGVWTTRTAGQRAKKAARLSTDWRLAAIFRRVMARIDPLVEHSAVLGGVSADQAKST
jgi:hypothetical protein